MGTLWQQRGSEYWPGTDALMTSLLAPAIYRYEVSMAGWYLNTVETSFQFPYKIYGNHDHILRRVTTAWGALEGNLGVLLNGIKGTGKTVSAQLIANWAIGQGIPVLMVHGPIPLVDVLSSIMQPVLVIFDEFEKTHPKSEDQQSLLTALDGMARSIYKRLFVFTTNKKSVDENFIDRPSRIRYCWEFLRLQDDVVEELVDDLLLPELKHLRPDIQTYLNTRKILSIDVVKTVLNEVNLFREPPSAFAETMNLTEQDVSGFTVEVLDSNRQVVRTLSHFFSPRRSDNARLRNLLTRGGRETFIETVQRFDDTQTFEQTTRGLTLRIVEATEFVDEWICEIRIPLLETWIGKTPKLLGEFYNDSLWCDVRPDGWSTPSWATKLIHGETLTDEETALKDVFETQTTVFGGTERQRFLLRITPNFHTDRITAFQFRDASFA